jgi:hypothetical protein
MMTVAYLGRVATDASIGTLLGLKETKGFSGFPVTEVCLHVSYRGMSACQLSRYVCLPAAVNYTVCPFPLVRPCVCVPTFWQVSSGANTESASREQRP